MSTTSGMHPWDEDVDESGSESDSMDLFGAPGSDAEMASPLTSHQSALPAGPPDSTMPTPKGKEKGKKKHSSAAAELTSPFLRPAPPVSCPSSFTSAALDLSPAADPFDPTSDHATRMAASHAAIAACNATPIPYASLSKLLDLVTSVNSLLASWFGKSWEEERDHMHLAWALLVMVGHIITLGWHSMPFKDIPNAPTLVSTLARLLPCDLLQHPPLSHGSADKAGPAPSTYLCGPPLEATA